MGAQWHPSPNFGPRRNGLRPELLVLHYTGMASTDAALARLCDPAFEVSAHYLISPEGHIIQMVAEDQRAWHAGAGQWCGKGDINSRSVGVELANRGDGPFPNPQMTALEGLMRQVMARWGIAAVNVIAHSDMAPDRKEDPGARFDWRRLALQGLALWPEGLGQDRPLDESLDAIGYPNALADKRLQAFRLRFRPWGQGPESAQDRMRAAAVAEGVFAARCQATDSAGQSAQ
ncbi:N-acetylmuramoyl-L-alanine amidase [Roseinatronobacter sp. NSM]|uniref:N-acetylmuramoyl-L-alanine amidase n=1 Tax=Roseinatronobacter sp. NSM TaxID=3457785 RepID=UPI0040361DB4